MLDNVILSEYIVEGNPWKFRFTETDTKIQVNHKFRHDIKIFYVMYSHIVGIRENLIFASCFNLRVSYLFTGILPFNNRYVCWNISPSHIQCKIIFFLIFLLFILNSKLIVCNEIGSLFSLNIFSMIWVSCMPIWFIFFPKFFFLSLISSP